MFTCPWYGGNSSGKWYQVKGQTNYDCPGYRCWRRAVVREPEFHRNFRHKKIRAWKKDQITTWKKGCIMFRNLRSWYCSNRMGNKRTSMEASFWRSMTSVETFMMHIDVFCFKLMKYDFYGNSMMHVSCFKFKKYDIYGNLYGAQILF